MAHNGAPRSMSRSHNVSDNTAMQSFFLIGSAERPVGRAIT